MELSRDHIKNEADTCCTHTQTQTVWAIYHHLYEAQHNKVAIVTESAHEM